MTELSRFSVEGNVATLSIDSPPVNALGEAVRHALVNGIAAAADDPSIEALVITCGGRTFFAGADITEFGKPVVQPDLTVVVDIIEASSKPVVAAIHGTALGGGLEVALACHYRVAVPSARVGLPEVHLGLLPGAGGTQRLPRLIGVDAALDLIVSGRQVKAQQALELGILDALMDEGTLYEGAVAFARSIVGMPVTRVRDRDDRLAEASDRPEFFAEYRAKNARGFKGFKAPGAIVAAIEAAVALPFEEGLKREAELFWELEPSIESQAQRYYFFAERETAKVPGLAKDTAVRPITSGGVVGAGTMGSGIAIAMVDAGLPVTLVETDRDRLDRALALIKNNWQRATKRGRMSAGEAERRLAMVTPSLSLDALDGCDLVIEAVFEEMAIKRALFAELDRIAKPGAILASNTSFLDLDAIAAATKRPEDVVGLHFFSPANVMRLLEVVRGARTSDVVLATALRLARTIGKVPVVSGVCEGFIANRIMSQRQMQADALVLEGVSPDKIDRAMNDYGFAMGPFQMIDLVGLDVIGRGSDQRTVTGDLVKLGRLGQKGGGGYYDYDAHRSGSPSPVAAEVIARVAAAAGIAQRPDQDAGAIVERLLFVVANEGAKLLESGIALRASDIDVAAILGYGWPVYTGGPMFWADTVGLPHVVATLRALEAAGGGATFTPSALLVRLAEQGGSFTRS